MNKKLPDEAGHFYVSLGPRRTQKAVAEHFRVAKRTVAYRAKKEGWVAQAQAADQKAMQATAQRAQDTNEEMFARHEKTARFLQARSIEALRNMPLRTEMAALRALDIGIRHERTARGEQCDSPSSDLAQQLRSQYAQFVTIYDGEDDAG